jgi:hypothetical protein
MIPLLCNKIVSTVNYTELITYGQKQELQLLQQLVLSTVGGQHLIQHIFALVLLSDHVDTRGVMAYCLESKLTQQRLAMRQLQYGLFESFV